MTEAFSPERQVPRIASVVGLEEEGRATIDGVPLASKDSELIVADMLRMTGGSAGGSTGNFGYHGGKIYFDGRAPEFTTPETADPKELAKYARANAELYVSALTNLCVARSHESREPVVVRMNRRVKGSDADTWGSHINVSLTQEQAFCLNRSQNARALMLGHAAARSFIVGAGLVTPYGLHYSQKRSEAHVDSLTGRMFGNTVYAIRDNKDIMDDTKLFEWRFESRDNDIHFSDWAQEVNVAGTVGMLAIAASPLLSEFPAEELAAFRTPSPVNPINSLELQPDGTIKRSEAILKALSLERRIASLMLHAYVEHGGELPPIYEYLFSETLRFCNDFERVLNSEATIELLADRVDWAAKCSLIMQGIAQSKDKRTLYDYRSRYTDWRYDDIHIEAERGRLVKVNYGAAYRLQRKGAFAKNFDAKTIEQAMTTPPSGTRAHTRVQLMKQHASRIVNVSWTGVQTSSATYRLDELRTT